MILWLPPSRAALYPLASTMQARSSGITTSGGIHGFLKSGGSYTTIDYPLAKFTFVTGINNAGEIVGWYDEGSEQGYASYHGFLAAPADAPTITGTVANQPVNDNATIDRSRRSKSSTRTTVRPRPSPSASNAPPRRATITPLRR
jgi:hypothetical protein